MRAALLTANTMPEVASLRRAVCDAASAFDASALDSEGAQAVLREWTAIANAADAAMAMTAARIAELGVSPSTGASDASDAVARATGTTAAKAKERMTRGSQMKNASETRKRASSGALSPEQSAAIADAVGVNPEAEAELLAAAQRLSLRELRELCARRKAERQDLQTIERRIHAKRSLRRWTDAEGAAHLHAIGNKREMALVDQALRRIIEQIFRQRHADDEREPHEAYAFDALIEMATQTLSGAGAGGAGAGGGGGGAGGGGAGGGESSPKRRDPMRWLTLVRLDLSALVRGSVQDVEVCEIPGVGPVSVATARDMLGESVLKLVITKGDDVLNVTHLGRGPNAAQKIALLWQYPACTTEGCPHSARLEDDHRYGFEWTKTRHTRLDELDRPCSRCHEMRTRFGWAYVEGKGRRPLVSPDDRRHPRHGCCGGTEQERGP